MPDTELKEEPVDLEVEEPEQEEAEGQETALVEVSGSLPAPKKRGRPFGTFKKPENKKLLGGAPDVVYDEAYMNVKDNRRMARKLAVKCMNLTQKKEDFAINGATLSKLLEQVTQCDRLMIELIKVKTVLDNMNGANQNPNGITAEGLYEQLSTEDTTEAPDDN